MTALTIDIDDRLIEALRETAARRHTTVDAIVRLAVSDVVDRQVPPETFRELAHKAPLHLDPERAWDRGASHDRSVLR